MSGRPSTSACQRMLARLVAKSELELVRLRGDPGGVGFAERHGFVVVNRIPRAELATSGLPAPFDRVARRGSPSRLSPSGQSLPEAFGRRPSEAMPDIPSRR